MLTQNLKAKKYSITRPNNMEFTCKIYQKRKIDISNLQKQLVWKILNSSLE